MRVMRGHFARAIATSALLLLLPHCHLGVLGIVMSGYDQGPYLPETLAKELGAGHVRTIGCLDVGLVMHERAGTELLDLHIGNRCAHPEKLDVQRVTIRGVDANGAARSIAISDPRSEIARYHVGGAERGKERLRLEGAHALARVCFHLEGVAPDVPSAQPGPLCFDRREIGWLPALGPIMSGGAT